VYLVFIAAVVDIETLSVPDIILYVLLGCSIFYAVFYSTNPILSLSLSLSLFFLLIGIGKFSQKILKIHSIGFGDVILIPVLSNFLHYDIVPYFIISSGVIGLLFGLLWKFWLGMGSKFPFTPPIFLAFFTLVLF
jgi:prepilin signal peptidase PulO-like enzyme (type II secretory pathway)